MISSFVNLSAGIGNLDSLGYVNESHRYAHEMGSVMDKTSVYLKRISSLSSSTLPESVKNMYGRDIYFNPDERVASSCIFNEMLHRFEESMTSELEIYESIIRQESILTEGVEYDAERLSGLLMVDEGKLSDLFKKGKDAIMSTSKKILDKAGELKNQSSEIVKAKKDDLVKWAKESKKEFVEKYENLKKLVSNIVKSGVNSVKEFIEKILEAFSSIGNNLLEVVKKLGCLKLEKNEKPAELDADYTEDIYKNCKSDDEKSFISNVIIRVNTMLSKDKDNAEKLMVNESLVDNKYIAWLAGYKTDGEKMSWWKCILIGLCASLVVWMIPKVLVIAGVGASVSVFIGALVAVLWNCVGLLKLIYRRNKEKKEGEKFFDKKTAIFFALSVLSTVFSVSVFIKTIGPMLGEICNSMGWTGGDDMGKFGEFVYKAARKLNPTECFNPASTNEISEEIQNFGGDFRGNDIVLSNTQAVSSMSNMPGASEVNVKAYEEFLKAMQSSHGSSGVLKAAEAFKDSPDLPTTYMLDTSKWGGSGPIRKAIKELVDAGKIPDSTILTTGGSLSTQKASKGVYGFCTFLTGLSKGQADMVFHRAGEIAGVDASTIQMHIFGTGSIANVASRFEDIAASFQVIAPNMPMLPVLMPMFDKRKWGKYRIRFAPATSGDKSYVVDRVEMHPANEIKETSEALDILFGMHDKAWTEAKNYVDDKKTEEPQFVVLYVRPDDDSKKVNEAKKKDTDTDLKDEIGIVIDTLSMAVADVCNFDKEAKLKRRKKPYFMKGLMSRLSFRPVENRDNDTKDYIRTMLGQTMKTLVMQNVIFGLGKKYIETHIEKKKASYKLRDTVLDGKKKVNADKVEFELGNFSPNELIECLDDNTKNNKISYDFLDGKYASNITVSRNRTGKILSGKVSADTSSIENTKYYRVTKSARKAALDDYEQKRQDYKAKKITKRPTKPVFIKGDDGEYYKKASKKMLADPNNKKKKLYDFVDLRIKPLLKKGELYKKLTEYEKIKKLLYASDDSGNVKLRSDVLDVLRPFLYRPEKTFAKDDEYQLSELLKQQGVEGEKLGWFKKLFKNEEQLHDTFKDMVEIIWDYLSDNTRSGVNEGLESDMTLFDLLIEDFCGVDDEDDEYEYDRLIGSRYENVDFIEESHHIPTFGEFLKNYR